MPGDREVASQLLSGVGLYGGYAGLANPEDPEERDLELHETTLSGDLIGDDNLTPSSGCCIGHAGQTCDDATCRAAVCDSA